ncbi:MAG: GNAT family N-acetyltransferase [Clostridia bacterium]|nr:GNAT family N-acetyltransferase [Clostridia bacterium]
MTKIVKNKLSFASAEAFDFDANVSSFEREQIEEIISFYKENAADDVEYAFALSCGCLCVRIFDMGRYSFLFPYELTEESDICGAVEDMLYYAVLEEIPMVISNVEREQLAMIFDFGYRHIDVDADSPDGSTYRVKIKNERMLLSDIPSVVADEISLSSFNSGDASPYAELCRDEENNRFWGYDYREDFPQNANDDWFLRVANAENDSATALILAVRLSGELIGEATLHNFDGRGGADVGIRILPRFQKKGYAKRALELLFSLSRDIGLITLFARIKNENTPSVALFSRIASPSADDGEATLFEINLYE